MGQGRGGVNLGAAHGSITINVQQPLQVPAIMQGVAAGVNSAMGSVNASMNKAQFGINSLTGAVTQLGGAFGITFGVAGAVQLARYAVEADKVATAYARQSVAAVSLAGSQSKLNELMNVYERVTGGAVDKATALADVTRLMAVGFASDAKELETFATAARGIAVAMGQSQEYVIGQLTLAIANQSFMRLDQIGLDAVEAKQRIDQLKAANKGLTDEMAYQQAIIGLATEKYGDLAKSAEAQATGAEKAEKAWKDARLSLGELVSGPIGFGGSFIAVWLQEQIHMTRMWQRAIEDVQRALGLAVNTRPGFNTPGFSSSGSIGGGVSSPGVNAAPRPSQELINARLEDIQELEADSLERRVDAIEQFGEQAASTERNYHKSMAREAEDFNRNRLRAEQEFAESVLDVRRDAARREERLMQDLARNIAQAQADSADRRSEWEEDHAKRITDAREQAAERVTELEEKYAKDREKVAEEHTERLEDAAGRLDAKAVNKEQLNYARQEAEAKEAHDTQLADLAEQLQERINQENENHAERLADEAEALDKRVRQANEAAQRQLDDARANDEQRIADMTADFEARKILEDEDRATRLARAAQDYADQVAEMDRQHGLNLARIAEDEADKRRQLDDDFQKELDALGIRTAAYQEKIRQFETAATTSFDRWWAHVNSALSAGANFGPAPLNSQIGAPGTFPSMSGGNRNSITIAPGAIVIYGAPGQSEERIGEIVDQRLFELLEEMR